MSEEKHSREQQEAQGQNSGGQQEPGGQETSQDMAALRAQVQALQRQLEAERKKAEKAVKDAAKGRDRLRELFGVVQETLGIEPPEGTQKAPWDERITAVQGELQQRLETMEQTLKAAQEEREAAQLAALRARIGAEMGLPAALINRLQGETEEDIRKDADELRKAMPRAAAVSPMNPASGQADSSIAEQIYRMRRGGFEVGFDLFSLENNEAMGGGAKSAD